MLEVLEAVDGSALYRWADACVTGIEKRCDEITISCLPRPGRGHRNESARNDARSGPGRRTTVRGRARGRRVRRGPGARARGGDGARGNSGAILSQVLRGSPSPEVAQARRRHLPFGGCGTHRIWLSRLSASRWREPSVTVLAAAADAVAAETAGAPLARLSAVAADAAAEAL
ncbi:dihydroxyacetone kinase, partial [Rhodococcus hoagii]|nr:dihydroxyacetone kinase [Prescottella equi]